MAQQVVTADGTLIIPGAYAKYTVAQSASNLSTTGVLMLVGEAAGGPDVTLESDLRLNSFGPDEATALVSKYKSGPIVDAFRGAVAASNDPLIQGAFSRVIVAKTNPSAKASSTLKNFDSSTYATIEDRSYGKSGNLITRSVIAKTAEVVPTTGAFAFLPPIASTNISVRVNGGAATAVTITATERPSALATALDAITGVDVSGGNDEGVLGSVTGTLALTVLTGNTVQIDRSVPFSALPTAGDTLYIPASSVLASIATQNAGAYIVTGAGASSITARKLLDVTGSPSALTPPGNQSAISSTGTSDVQCYAALTVKAAPSDPIPGFGKSLEIAELTSGTGLLSYLCYTLGTGSPSVVTWISKAVAPYVITSLAEYVAQLTAARQLDNVTEDLSAGGPAVLLVSYTGTTASAVLDGTSMTITVAGGAGSSPAAIPLGDYPTIADLAQYLNSLAGFKAAPGTAVLGAQPSTSLDRGTFGICSTFGAYSGRIKQDAYRFNLKLQNDAVLVQLHAPATAGLPAPQVLGFLAGGSRGATTDATFNAAVDKLELVRGNFLVPLFSRDAAADVADALTDPTSTYTIANIHSYCQQHVTKLSTFKRRRPRQALLSFKGTFAAARAAASGLASARCLMTFQDVRTTGTGTNGSPGVFQFAPWMAAAKAAGMQAAGFYRPIVERAVLVSGVLQAAGDYSDQSDTNQEDALTSGLLPLRHEDDGSIVWVSDQTTYGKDANFVYNSLQAVYVADTVAITSAIRMERSFVGRSVAEITATMARIVFDGIMGDMRSLKLIAASDDAPAGYTKVKIVRNGPSLQVEAEIKVAGATYFVPISFLVTPVQQSA